MCWCASTLRATAQNSSQAAEFLFSLLVPELECARQSLKCLPMHTIRASQAFFSATFPFYLLSWGKPNLTLLPPLYISLFLDCRSLYGLICLDSRVFSTILSEMSLWEHLRHSPTGVGTSGFLAPSLRRHFCPAFLLSWYEVVLEKAKTA